MVKRGRGGREARTELQTKRKSSTDRIFMQEAKQATKKNSTKDYVVRMQRGDYWPDRQKLKLMLSRQNTSGNCTRSKICL